MTGNTATQLLSSTPAAEGRLGRGRLAESGGVLAAYTVLALALTWPLATRFTQALPDGSDGWQYLWNLWWMKTALLDLHTNPFHSAYLYYPTGANLLFDTATPLLGVLSIPFQLVGLPLPAIYNLLVWFSFIAAGYGTYLLVRELAGARPAAFVAGLIFAFCPYHFAHLRGQLNLVSLQGIPFYVLALLKAWPPPTPTTETDATPPTTATRGNAQWRWAALAGLWLAANFYTEVMYALFLGLFTAWFVAWRLLPRHAGPGWRGSLGRLAVIAAVAGGLAAPLLVPMVQEARSASYMQATPREITFYSSDLTDAFVPNLFHPLWPDRGQAVFQHFFGRPPAEMVVFAGYTALGLSLIALWMGWRRAEVRFWGWTALGAWVLSLGPILHVWGASTFGGLRIPLPYAVLYYVPFFNIFRVPSRLMVLAMLALAVLSGYALAAQAGRWRLHGGRISGRAASVVAGLLVLAEFLAVPYPLMTPRDQPAFYQEVAREPGTFGVLDLPLTPVTAYLGDQTVHQKPIVDGHLSRQPPDPFVEDTPVLRYLLPTTPVDDPLATAAARTGLADLRRANVRYVFVHWWLPYGPEIPALQAKLARVFAGVPPQRLPDADMDVYTLLP